jgi:hypothetical protein
MLRLRKNSILDYNQNMLTQVYIPAINLSTKNSDIILFKFGSAYWLVYHIFQNLVLIPCSCNTLPLSAALFNFLSVLHKEYRPK